MKIDEIAKQYMKETGLDHLSVGNLNAMHDIYDIYKQQKGYKAPKKLFCGSPHPRFVLHCVSQALAKSKLFEIRGKIPTCWGSLNYYILKRVSKEVDGIVLWDADPNCDCIIESQWSGVKCPKCGGWHCE